ncbi:hypothetical protein VTK26DRAFT_6326 [Humicola hyalothermophila]
MSLVRLPYELVCYVVRHLNLADARSLSLSCKRFQFLFEEPNIAKLLLEGTAPHCTEARDARVSGRYAAELRRLTKRREAISSVSPYLVAVVGHAETWLYENGVLCYVRRRQLRVLDLHRSAAHEIVIDTRRLLDQAIPEPRANCRYRFQLLYYADDIISALYTHARHGETTRSSWLVVLNARAGQLITVRPLASTSQVFVRNNHQFLYYGTHSERGRDGYRRWVFYGFDLAARAWFDQPLEYPAVIGSDIGSTVCFEIFDGYFYCLSNQACLEVEELDWVSYYTCFRFPLVGRHGFRELEHSPQPQLWRRNQTEGPIDDRWTFLRMFKDETTGHLKVVESRKEWLKGRITARRTYYTTVINFESSDSGPARGCSSDGHRSPAPPDPFAFADDKMEPDGGSRDVKMSGDPHLVHLGDDAFTYTLSKCPLRSYYAPAQAFIDLVDDNPSYDPSCQRIRLRGASRRFWTPGELEQQMMDSAAATQQAGGRDSLEQQIERLYKSGAAVFWPPEEEDPLAPDDALADLYAVLNPPGYLGRPHGSWDERSLVYATGDHHGTNRDLKALVFVSWDPSIYLANTPPYPGNISPGARPGVAGRADVAPRAGNGRRVSNEPPKAATAATNPTAWKTVQPAAYLDIARGYHFAR